MTVLNYIDTTLRDGQMSLWATEMRTDMILPVAGTLDKAGFDAVEIIAGGGFDKKMIRDLREDPLERIRLVRERMQKTPLRIVRGRYLTGFQITPRCIDDLWWDRMALHGIRQARLADSSNTVWRLERLVGSARRVGVVPIVNLIFAYSPKHTDEYYAERARAVAKLNVHRICLKDPGGLLTPERTRTLVSVILANTGGTPLEFHTHCHTGLGSLCSLEAIKCGVRYVNTAIPPLAESSSNPSVFSVMRNARHLGYESPLDMDALKSVEQHFKNIAMLERRPIGAPAEYDVSQYMHQVPGGMISNFRLQLSQAGLADRLDSVLEETARVRKDLGFPIMVTPYSQFVGVQAVMNVVAGERYRRVSDEIIQYALGFWGDEERDSIDPDVRTQILASPRARELADWRPPEPSIDEMRIQLGDATLDDDTLLLRYIAGREAVEAMKSMGPAGRPESRQGDLAAATDLVRTIAQYAGGKSVRIDRDGFSLRVESGRVQSQ